MPAELEDIINKALEKDRNLRYQHAADMRADLQRLKRDTDTGRAVAASSGRVAAAHDSTPSAPVATCSSPTARPTRRWRLHPLWPSIPASSSVKAPWLRPRLQRKDVEDCHPRRRFS